VQLRDIRKLNNYYIVEGSFIAIEMINPGCCRHLEGSIWGDSVLLVSLQLMFLVIRFLVPLCLMVRRKLASVSRNRSGFSV